MKEKWPKEREAFLMYVHQNKMPPLGFSYSPELDIFTRQRVEEQFRKWLIMQAKDAGLFYEGDRYTTKEE